MNPEIRLLLLEQLLASKGIDVAKELEGVAIGLDGSVVFGAVKPSGEGTGKGEATGESAAPAAPDPSATPAAPAAPAAPSAPAQDASGLLAALTGNGTPAATNSDPSKMTDEERSKHLRDTLLPALMSGRETVDYGAKA